MKRKLRPRQWPAILAQILIPYIFIRVLASQVGDPIPDRQWVVWLAHGIIFTVCVFAIVFDEYTRSKE